VGGHVEVQNATAVMGQNQENVKNLKIDRGHGEEINVRPANELVRLVGDSPTKVKVSAL
jgi:hypothetical protein